MWITKKELNRRIEAAIAEVDRERYRNERINELERHMDKATDALWARLCELERFVKANGLHGVADDGVCQCKNT